MTLTPLQLAVRDQGGGVLGGMRRWLLLDPNVVQYFGEDNVRSGRFGKINGPQSSFPCLLLLLPSEMTAPQSDRVLLLLARPSAIVYAVGRDTADFLGKYVAARLLNAHDQMTAYNRSFTLVPDGPFTLIPDPKLSELGGDVWRYETKYLTYTSLSLS